MPFIITGLTSSDPKIRLFSVEVYTDSALTNLVDVQAAHGVANPTTGGSMMHGYLAFPNLTPNTTYYFLPKSTDTLSGIVTNGTSFVATTPTDSTGPAMTNPMTTQGDMIVGGASGAPQSLAAAQAGYVLTANGAGQLPSWQAAGGFTSGNSTTGHWVKDPTGHIRQWGKVTTDINNGQISVAFPTMFTDVNSIAVNVTTKSSTDRITFVVDGTVSTSGFTVGNNGSGGYAYWVADGY